MNIFSSVLTRNVAFGFSCLFVLAACQSKQTATTAQATVTKKDGTKIFQSGSVEKPTEISSASVTAEVALPKGSVLEVTLPSATSPGKISVTLSENSALKSTSATESISLPKTFLPPLPPSATELAKAQGVKLFYFLSAGLVLLTLGLAYTEHFKAAIIAGIGAVAVPIFGNFVSEASAVTIALTATVGAGCLYAAWYLLQHRIARPNAPAQTSP